MSIETEWHAFMGYLEELRHELDPKFHAVLDKMGFHATQIASIAGAEVAKVATGPAVADVAKVAVADVTKAVETEVKL